MKASDKGAKGWKIGLAIMGAIQILFGVVFAFMAISTAVFVVASRFIKTEGLVFFGSGMVAWVVVFYLLFAVASIVVGVGTIRARRWARALVLISSWIWLIMGIAGFLIYLITMPEMMKNFPAAPPGMESFSSFMTGSMIAISGFFYVLLPGCFVIFFRNKNVKALCEARDPKPCWTDRCPLPVLALSLFTGLTALSMFWMVSLGGLFPFFGKVLSGVPGIGLTIILMGLTGYFAWGLYKLKLSAWWGTVVTYSIFMISTILTFGSMDMAEIYAYMKVPAEFIQQMEKMGSSQYFNFTLMSALPAVLYLAFMLYSRKYFIRHDN